MLKKKLIRITTIPLSLEKLLEGQLSFMSRYFEVIAISSDVARLKAYADNEGIRCHPLELTRKITPIKDLLAVWKLYRFLKREQPFIVHTHTPKAGIVGMMAAWLAKVPHRLHTVAGLPLMEATGCKKKLLVYIEKRTYRYATKVFPNSKGLMEYIISEKLVAPSKLYIVGKGSSNGIDTSFFNPVHFGENDRVELKTSLGIPQKDFVFLFVGRIVKDKGIVEMVDAFINLLATHPHSSLLLVGPSEPDLDPLPETTEKTIHSHPKIFSVGFQEDVRPYFAVSHVLVFPSYREGFPNVVMQAGAMGIPCIVSNINGCNEIVTDGLNGLIIPVKNVNALHAAMDALLREGALYGKLVAESRGAIVSRYERHEIWRALLGVYQNLEDS